MEYGLIGEHLGHSFSKIIHERIAPYTYELHELAPSGLAEFMQKRPFKAINVTIPYKEQVIPFLDGGLDASAARVGAVNVVVNRGGRLFGSNTDYAGFKALATHAGVDFRGRSVLILGTGGAAKAVAAVVRDSGASRVTHAVRHVPAEGEVSYDELRKGGDCEIVVNATPVGMYPDTEGCPVSPALFSRLEGVLDCVANPLRTTLVMEALQRGVKAEGGTYMLVAQAVSAIEKFLDRPQDPSWTDTVFSELMAEKTNIVLTGMPSSGKSTVGALLAERLHRPLIDTDERVVQRVGMSIADYVAKYGEASFREVEAGEVAAVARMQGQVIATGGGVPLRPESVRRLRQNGTILFLDRPLEQLTPTFDRPFSRDMEALRRRYEERYPVYLTTADTRIVNDGTVEETLRLLLKAVSQNLMEHS